MSYEKKSQIYKRLLRIVIISVALCVILCSGAVKGASLPRAEYPRPQFERADWQNLNGIHFNAEQRRRVTNHIGNLVEPASLGKQTRNLLDGNGPPTLTPSHARRYVLCHVTHLQTGGGVSREK